MLRDGGLGASTVGGIAWKRNAKVTALFTDMVGFTTFSERPGGRHNHL